MTSDNELLQQVHDRTIRIEERTKNIDKHLEQLNSKVATNVSRITDLEKTDTQILEKFGVVLEDYRDRKIEERKSRRYIYERLVWGAGLLAIAVLSATGVLDINF